jgi:hypothetical protein
MFRTGSVLLATGPKLNCSIICNKYRISAVLSLTDGAGAVFTATNPEEVYVIFCATSQEPAILFSATSR